MQAGGTWRSVFVLPGGKLLLLLALTAGCAEPAPLARSAPTVGEPAPGAPAAEAAASPALAEPPSAAASRWVWVFPVDHGIRADRGGGGGFLAPRAHGKHNGIDLVAPLGTPVRAPCSGKGRAGQNSSHGKWVQLVCPLPPELGIEPARRVSLFFAHLLDVAGLGETPTEIDAGAELGSVGKTGNASAAIIAAHLHFEAIVHDDESSALAEHHSGRDQSDTRGAREVAGVLSSRCLGPLGFAPKSGSLWRSRRADPFVLLICLGAEKPAFTRPNGKLGEASYPWSSEYSATGFDVDSGSFAVK